MLRTAGFCEECTPAAEAENAKLRHHKGQARGRGHGGGYRRGYNKAYKGREQTYSGSPGRTEQYG